jgi:ArsR family transcriptional regulator, virulence genes transcriptional regulator
MARLTIYSNNRIYASMKMNIDAMEAAADSASDLLKSLANRHRLLIVCQLIDGERSVGDLAEFLGLRDSTVSQHLALLRKDGLVSARRDAQTIYYSIASDPAREILAALYRVYCTPPTGRASSQKKTMRAKAAMR